MKWKMRSELKPGDCFIFYADVLRDPVDVLVVLDDKTEVGFWRGELCRLGDLAPSYRVCVLACK